MNQNRDWRRCLTGLLLASVVCFSGCTVSENPLSDPALSKVDPQLIGVWKEVKAGEDATENSDDTKVELLVIGKCSSGQFEKICRDRDLVQPSFPVFPPGLMAASVVALSPDDEHMYGETHCFFPTQIGADSYANQLFLAHPSKPGNPKSGKNAEPPPAYNFMRYEVQGNRLRIWQKDEDAIETAIKRKKLAGKVVRKGKNRNLRIMESTENLQKVCQGDEGKKIFPRNTPPELVYERVKLD